jgi:hypothetical protein
MARQMVVNCLLMSFFKILSNELGHEAGECTLLVEVFKSSYKNHGTIVESLLSLCNTLSFQLKDTWRYYLSLC